MRKAGSTGVLACRAMTYDRTWRRALTPQLDSAMPLPPLIGHERVKTRLASHPVASVRLLLRRLALTPAMGKRKVFIVGDAERLIPQLGTEVAANALLKALEEPPADSVIIITAADPNALLPTIMSRVVLVRMARIADSEVTAFAQQMLGISSKAELAQRVTAAEGCLGKLFATASLRSGQPGGDQADRFLDAPWLFALGQVPFQARGGFTDMLDA